MVILRLVTPGRPTEEVLASPRPGPRRGTGTAGGRRTQSDPGSRPLVPHTPTLLLLGLERENRGRGVLRDDLATTVVVVPVVPTVVSVGREVTGLPGAPMLEGTGGGVGEGLRNWSSTNVPGSQRGVGGVSGSNHGQEW